MQLVLNKESLEDELEEEEMGHAETFAAYMPTKRMFVCVCVRVCVWVLVCVIMC